MGYLNACAQPAGQSPGQWFCVATTDVLPRPPITRRAKKRRTQPKRRHKLRELKAAVALSQLSLPPPSPPTSPPDLSTASSANPQLNAAEQEALLALAASDVATAKHAAAMITTAAAEKRTSMAQIDLHTKLTCTRSSPATNKCKS